LSRPKPTRVVEPIEEEEEQLQQQEQEEEAQLWYIMLLYGDFVSYFRVFKVCLSSAYTG
jgi:hypothetical protein